MSFLDTLCVCRSLAVAHSRRRHLRFAASWTLVNAHEVACISGIAAAVNLGAEYPHDLERDDFAFSQFQTVLSFPISKLVPPKS